MISRFYLIVTWRTNIIDAKDVEVEEKFKMENFKSHKITRAMIPTRQLSKPSCWIALRERDAQWKAFTRQLYDDVSVELVVFYFKKILIGDTYL